MLVRVNTTGKAVDTTIELGGQTIAITFAAPTAATDVFEVSLSGLSIDIGGFVTIEGNVTFSNGTFAGEGLRIFLGRGPATLGTGGTNPLAVGVLLTDARIGLVKVGTDYAMVASGTVTVLGGNGATITGTAAVRVNTTGGAVDRTLTVPGSTGTAVPVVFATGARVTSFSLTDAPSASWDRR